MKKNLAILFSAIGLTGNAIACSSQYNILLETFGEGVLVELRAGTPGNSRIIRTATSHGGNVRFTGLCSGNYFLAIGNDNSVSVTPVRYVQDGTIYNSTITLQRGSGNVTKKSRSSL